MTGGVNQGANRLRQDAKFTRRGESISKRVPRLQQGGLIWSLAFLLNGAHICRVHAKCLEPAVQKTVIIAAIYRESNRFLSSVKETGRVKAISSYTERQKYAIRREAARSSNGHWALTNWMLPEFVGAVTVQ